MLSHQMRQTQAAQRDNGFFRLSTINSQPSTATESLLGGALPEKLGDIEVHEIGVMENNRLDRALHLVALVAVRGDDVQDFAGNAVLVGQRNAAERMPHLLTEFGSLSLTRLCRTPMAYPHRLGAHQR